MCQKYPSVLIHPIINNSTSPHPGRKSRSFLLGCWAASTPPFLGVISSTRSCDPCFAVLGSHKGVISTRFTRTPTFGPKLSPVRRPPTLPPESPCGVAGRFCSLSLLQRGSYCHKETQGPPQVHQRGRTYALEMPVTLG